MPTNRSTDLATLARLAREGDLDLSQVSLRVKADLLLSTPHPAADDILAFGELAAAVIPEADEANALILARKLASWPHAPAAAIDALRERGGAVLAVLLASGLPATGLELETMAEQGDAAVARAVAERADLDAATAHALVARAERDVDLALLANPAIVPERGVLEIFVERARADAAYAQALLARGDLPALQLTPLFLHAGPERRTAILESLAALEALGATQWRPLLDRQSFSGWVALAATDPEAAFVALGQALGAGTELAEALQRDGSRDLVALALTAAGASVEDATRFLIMLGDEAAHSVGRIHALVALMRSVRPGVARRVVMQVSGVGAPARSRGRHQPATAPGGTPARATTGRSEAPQLGGLNRRRDAV